MKQCVHFISVLYSDKLHLSLCKEFSRFSQATVLISLPTWH